MIAIIESQKINFESTRLFKMSGTFYMMANDFGCADQAERDLNRNTSGPRIGSRPGVSGIHDRVYDLQSFHVLVRGNSWYWIYHFCTWSTTVSD